MSELEQTLREALEKEDIHIEQQSDDSYMATWPSRYGGLDKTTGCPNLLDSVTGPSLIGVAIVAIRRQKRIEYWRGKKDALDQATHSLHTLAQEVYKEPLLKKPTDEEPEDGPKQGE